MAWCWTPVSCPDLSIPAFCHGSSRFCFWDSSAHLCHWVCPCVDPVPFLWKELSKLVLRVVIGSVIGACCGCVGLYCTACRVHFYLPLFSSEVQALQMMSAFSRGLAMISTFKFMLFEKPSDNFYFSHSGQFFSEDLRRFLLFKFQFFFQKTWDDFYFSCPSFLRGFDILSIFQIQLSNAFRKDFRLFFLFELPSFFLERLEMVSTFQIQVILCEKTSEYLSHPCTFKLFFLRRLSMISTVFFQFILFKKTSDDFYAMKHARKRSYFQIPAGFPLFSLRWFSFHLSHFASQHLRSTDLSISEGNQRDRWWVHWNGHVVIMTDSDEVFQSAATAMLRLARASVWSWMLGILCGCFTLCPWCRCICSCQKVHGMSSLCDWITRYHELLIVEVIIRSCFVFWKSSQQILPSTSSIFGPNWGLSSRKCDGWPLDEVRWHSTPGGSKQLWCLWPKVCDGFAGLNQKNVMEAMEINRSFHRFWKMKNTWNILEWFNRRAVSCRYTCCSSPLSLGCILKGFGFLECSESWVYQVLAAATDPDYAKSQGYATAWSALGQKTINGTWTEGSLPISAASFVDSGWNSWFKEKG